MSSSDIAFSVDNVSKVYRLGAKEKANDSLGASLMSIVRKPLRNYRKYRALYKFEDLDAQGHATGGQEEVLWALRNVSFDVKRGETIGIIGRNGAGKSTLLKVLARITHPSSGRIQISGRIASLLEVGTGFHPELSGRENIYLNGTVLGMRKNEVDRKFDEIVDFSGVDKFLDTPVKRYSSGMRVRLAFAVAAHLEPEILIVDEVLAVGDAAFQRKCLNKMQDVGSHGRTVLFVSHNMASVSRLCERGILLNEGTIIEDGAIQSVVAQYLNSGTGTTASRNWSEENSPGAEFARLRSVRIIDNKSEISEAIDIRQPVGLQMQYDVVKSGAVLLPHFNLYNEEGVCIFTTLDQDPQWRGKPREQGSYVSTAWIPENFLAEGTFFVGCNCITLEPNLMQFRESQVVAFQVVDSMDGDTARGDYAGRLRGLVRPLLKWETREVGEEVSATGS